MQGLISFSFLLSLLFLLTGSRFQFAQAVQFSVVARRSPHAEPMTGLSRRGSVNGSSPLTNSADISYYTNITLGGGLYNVLIDTGSSDLWVAGTVPVSKDTGLSSGVTYAIGAVEGPIKTADLEFSGYTVSSQAYLEITPDSNSPSQSGLIGLGPNSGSTINDVYQGNAGASVVKRIFLQNMTTPNFLTVLLGRIEDDNPNNIFGGDISVGDVLEGYDAILNQPKLPVTIVPVQNSGNQHFQTLIDANGIIGPDGKAISISTEVDGTSNKKQATAVFDTGFSLSQVPKSVADAIYSGFSGAEYGNVTGIGNVWIVPCDLEVNISFKFSGQNYSVHPLDTTLQPEILGLRNVRNSKGQDSCIGTYQPISFSVGSDVSFDIILGMSFIRNVYALFNYGDFIGGSSSNRGDPYLQLLSTTNASQAHAEFVNVRLGGVDTTGNQIFSSTNNGSSSSSSGNSDTKKKDVILALGVAGIAIAALLLVLAVYFYRRNSKKKAPTAMWGSYRRVESPAPPAMVSSSVPGSTGAAMPYYNPTYGTNQLYDPQPHAAPAPSYYNPWDQRR